jgi:hypothetical protein
MRPKSSNPRSVVFAFRTDARTARRIRRAAAADDRRPSAFLRREVERLLNESAAASATD